jgi:hypothetical protein
MSSFVLAVFLGLLAGPSVRVHARFAADVTAGCTHDPFKIPGDNVKITTIDGVTTVSQHPTFQQFEFHQAWRDKDYVRNIVKSQDGSVTLNAHLESGTTGGASRLVQINEKNKAVVGFTPKPPDCCHKGSFNAWGFLEGEMTISGAGPGMIEPGTITVARVGIGAPAFMRARVEYDFNCNGFVDAQHDDVQIAAVVFVEGNLGSFPPVGFKTGYIVKDTVYTVDGDEFPAPRVTTNLDQNSWMGRLKIKPYEYGPMFVHEPFRNQQSFTDLQHADVRVEARRSEPKLFTAGAWIDIRWDNTVLDAQDIDENKYVRLEKE